MKKIVLFIALFISTTIATNAQESAKFKPFTFVGFGVTVTGTYSEGFLKSKVINGTNILWGLISWGGSTQIECLPGNAVCRVEVITNFQINKTVTNESGEKCFEAVATSDGSTPVVIGEKDGTLTFAIDYNQATSIVKKMCNGGTYDLKEPFVLYPALVEKLNLSNDVEEKGYLIPAGSYPLYKDGNIYYWTFTPPGKN